VHGWPLRRVGESRRLPDGPRHELAGDSLWSRLRRPPVSQAPRQGASPRSTSGCATGSTAVGDRPRPASL
jgi:hypothetical protein